MQRQTRRVQPVVIVSVVVLAAAIVVLVPTLRRAVFQGVTQATRPLTSASLSLIERLGWASALRQPTEDENGLRQQLEKVTEELTATRQQLEAQENAGRLTAFLSRLELPSVSAVVLGYSPDPGIQSFVINVGRDQNVRVGQAVITDDGWMVGKIQVVHETTSTVLLLSDSQSLVLARIQNTAGSQGVVRGERGLTVRLDLIPKNDQLTRGQTIVTSGLEPGLPPDLLIGTIASIEQRSGEVFQRAQINIPIRYGRVRTVAVITL